MTNPVPGATLGRSTLSLRSGPTSPKLCLALLGLAVPAWSQPAPAAGAYAQALARAQSLYLAHLPGQPTLDAALRLPPPPSAAQDDAAVRSALDAAKDVQLGCAAPCADPADVSVYRGKVELVATRLGMKGPQVDSAVAHYLPAGKPRLRAAGAAAPDAAAKALDAEVVARLLASSSLAPQVRQRLGAEALRMAEALRRSPAVTADARGYATVPGAGRRRLTPQQIAQLNAIPRAQADILRRLATTPPPPPQTAQQRREAALRAADAEIAAHPSTIGDSYNYWAREAKDPHGGFFWRNYAKLNKGLLTFSGLKAVEESAARLGYVWDNPDVRSREKFWLGTKLAGNAAMTALTFLPAASFAKSLQAGGGFYWISKGGAAVPGMARAAPRAAEAMSSAGGTLSRTIAKAVPEGTEVTKDGLRSLMTSLNEKAARYGVRVIEGGTTGESVARGGDIYVSLKAGAQHEMVHVVQQTYTRVLALEQAAARYGTTVEALDAAQRAEAFAQAARWETASYAQLESQAFRATGFGGGSGGAAYGRQLLLTGTEVSNGMRNGTVLEGAFGPGARAYGRLTQILGHSQAQIGTGIGAVWSGMMNTPMGDGVRRLADEGASRYTEADAGRQIRDGTRVLQMMTPAPFGFVAAPLLAPRPPAAPAAPAR